MAWIFNLNVFKKILGNDLEVARIQSAAIDVSQLIRHILTTSSKTTELDKLAGVNNTGRQSLTFKDFLAFRYFDCLSLWNEVCCSVDENIMVAEGSLSNLANYAIVLSNRSLIFEVFCWVTKDVRSLLVCITFTFANRCLVFGREHGLSQNFRYRLSSNNANVFSNLGRKTIPH